MAGERPDTAMEPGSAALEPRAPQRVMITRMVLDNFKSYAGPITIGPFDANMTSVVGPNGSGKSNVIDAMLFVFGFRANKMRQGKLSELISLTATIGLEELIIAAFGCTEDEQLFEQHSPGQHGTEHQQDHDRFNQRIGLQVHLTHAK